MNELKFDTKTKAFEKMYDTLVDLLNRAEASGDNDAIDLCVDALLTAQRELDPAAFDPEE